MMKAIIQQLSIIIILAAESCRKLVEFEKVNKLTCDHFDLKTWLFRSRGYRAGIPVPEVGR